MAVVDDLQIKIQGDAIRANDAIDKLVGKLDRLSTALGSLSSKNLNSLSTGVTRLTTAMAGMNNVKTADFTRLAKNIEKLAALDSAKLSQSAGSLHQFINALGSLNNIKVSDSAKNIGDLAHGIAQLGYKSSTKAIQNIPQLATAMHQLMTTLSTAPKVSQNIINMTNALAKLARTGSSSGKAATSLGRSLDTYTRSTKRASKGTWSLASAIGKMYATYWMLFRAFRLVGKAIDISSSLTEVQNVVDVTFGDMAKKVEKFSETSIEQFGMSELSVKKYASTFQAMGSAMGIDTALIGTANKFLNKQTEGYVGLSNSMADVSLTLTKLTADMASFYNVEQKDVADDLASIFTGSTRPLRQYGLDLTQATLKEWALSQGMNANIKSMTQAEKAMLRYQYVLAHTGAAQGDFARTVDTWANQTRILKQNFEQLGSIIGGVFINMLKPLVKALNNAMSHIIAFAQVVSNALGKIFGWTYESGGGGVASDMEYAADSSEDLAGGLADAEKNAKKLKTHLLGIDELNVFDPSDADNGNAGSGGSGSGGGAGASGGQWTKGESIFKQFESEIDTLYELGEKINETLTKVMDGIDWERIYKRAEGFGRGLAQFLNGLISPELFGAVGRTIASSLNTAIYAALSFAKTFNFYEFGVSLATSINEFFRTFDFQSLAETINIWANGLWTTFTTALNKINWIDAYNGIMDFLENLDIGTVGIVVGALTIKKILSLKIAENVIVAIGGKISTKLASVIGVKLGIELSGALSGAGLGTVLLTAGKSIAETLWMGIAGFFGNTAAISGLAFVNPIIKAFSGIGSVVAGLSTAFFNFFAMWKDGFSWIKEALMVLGTAFAAVGAVILGAPVLVSGVVAAITAAIATVVIVIHDNWNAISSFFTKAIPAFWSENIAPWFTAEKWLGLYDTIRSSLETKWGEVKEWWSETAIVSWWEEDVKPWFKLEKWSNLFNNIWDALKAIWTRTAIWWHNTALFNWWNNNVSPWFTKTKWETLLKTIPNEFKNAFEKAKEWVKEKVQSMYDFVKGIIDKIKTAISGISEKISGLVSKASSIGGSIFGGGGKAKSVKGFATGGFPEPSSLFWAGENGVPEILGTVGGRTAVAGGAEITGIRDAVYDVGQSETALLRAAVSLLETIAAKDTNTYIDGRELVSAYDKRKTRNGFSFT